MLSAEPVRDPTQFVGREREIVQITEILVAKRSCCLVGPAGSGKTSLLLHLQQMIDLVLDIPPVAVYLDLRSVRQAGDFYEPILRILGHKGDDELALGQVLFPDDAPEVLLLLDNLAQAGVGWSSLIRSALRGWINEGKIMVVVASSQPLTLAAPDLQGTLLQIALPPLPEREARALITQYLEHLGHPAEPETVSLLLTTAGGYPERIRRAIELWNRTQNDQDFDWKRTFLKEHPQQATLADELGGWHTELESEAPEAYEAATRPVRNRRSQTEKKEKPLPTYTLDDPSEFLGMLILLGFTATVWIAIGSWEGLIVFLLLLGLWIGLAWALVRFGGEHYRTSTLVGIVRWLPLIGRFAPQAPDDVD